MVGCAACAAYPPYRLRSSETFAFDPLTLHLAGAAHRLGGFARPAFGGFFIVPAKFHLAKNAFALELLFERLQRLVDVIVANENLHLADNSCGR